VSRTQSFRLILDPRFGLEAKFQNPVIEVYSMKRNKGTLIIKRFVSQTNDNNAYVLVNGDEVAVFDAADAHGEISNLLDEQELSLKYLLATHGHKSHLRSLSVLKERLGGTLCIHELDLDLLKESDNTLEPDMTLKDNASLPLGDTVIKVLHTPGHTPGSLCFYVKKARALFSGDTLLKGEFGRIWGPHSMGLMLRSLKRLNSVIPPKTTVYPGHGPFTTMSDEAWLDCLDNLS
jgi:hydroxyacylglutathione hydrolase